MSRWILGIVAAVAMSGMAQLADAQVYTYGVPGAVYAPGAYVAPVVPSRVVTSGYAVPAYVAPAYASPVVQMAYTAPVYAGPVYAAPVYAAPVVAAPLVVGPNVVRHTVRGGPLNYTETVRTYGPAGPHYARVHVHHGLFGTTVRERVR